MSAEAAAGARRLCVFSHFDPQGAVADYVLFHLDAIAAAGFQTVFVTAGVLRAGEARRLAGRCALVVERENVGLDFGAWRAAFARLGAIGAERLLLVNDSVYGPLAPLEGFLARLTAQPADMWGAVESAAFGRHLQSWFLLLSPAAYRSEAFTDLLRAPIPAGLSKWELVQRYEIGLSRRLLDAGLRLHAAYVAEAHGGLARAHPYNPCGLLWRELAEGPAPYLKTSMLRANPVLAPGVGGWRRLCARLEPRLVEPIARDLARRGAHPPTGLAARLRASLGRSDPAEWPEAQWLLRLDQRLAPGTAGARATAAAFRGAVTAGRRLRARR